MAQTVPPPPADAPRPLPRRGTAVKAVRPPRLVPQDWAWMAVLALLSLAVSRLMPHPTPFAPAGVLGFVAASVLAYLLAWRARDRTAGVVAGLLLATSVPFALHATGLPREAAFALLTLAALFSFVAGSSLLALAFAGLATLARPDGLLLGLLLLVLSFAQGRRRAPLGALTFLLFAIGGWAILTRLGHTLPSLHVGPRAWLWAGIIAPGVVFVTWLLLPFCGELGEAPRRARWLPIVLWALVYLIAGSFVRVGNRDAVVAGLLPVWFVLAAGGLSRLLPALTGEIPQPWVRYVLATLAVLSLLGIRLRAEWPRLQTPSRSPGSVAIPSHPAVPPSAILVPAAIPILHHAAAPTGARPVSKPVAKPAVATHALPARKPVPVHVVKKPVAAIPRPHPILRARPFFYRYRARRAYRRAYRRY